MKASCNWLRALSGLSWTDDEIAARLTSLGFEVEDVARFPAPRGCVVVELLSWAPLDAGENASTQRHADQKPVASIEARGSDAGKPKQGKVSRASLHLVEIQAGAAIHRVVCAAPSLPELGTMLVWAPPGAWLPGLGEVREKQVGGVLSPGLLCGEQDLGLSCPAAGADGAEHAATDRLVRLGKRGEVEGVEVGMLLAQACLALARVAAQSRWAGEAEWPRLAEGFCVPAIDLSDAILDLGLTPNRPDALGHVGLARELLVAHAYDEGAWADVKSGAGGSLGSEAVSRAGDGDAPSEPDSSAFTTWHWPTLAPFEGRMSGHGGAVDAVDRSPSPAAESDPPSDALSEPRVRAQVHAADSSQVPRAEGWSLQLAAHTGCGRYEGTLMVMPSGATAGETPLAMRVRLARLGIRSLGPVVDATQWTMMTWGHPTHAWDADRLVGPTLFVRSAEEGESMESLQHTTLTLGPEDTVVADARGPVALAGVIGGTRAEVHAETKRVLLEVAYFSPSRVRRSAKAHACATDASHRFERGVDPEGPTRVMETLAALLSELCALQRVQSFGWVPPSEGLGAGSPSPSLGPPLQFRHARLTELAGYEVPPAHCAAILRGLGCALRAQPGEMLAWEVKPPGFRPDLVRPVDLTEEVLRVVGFDAIPSTLPRPMVSATEDLNASSPMGEGVLPWVRVLSERLASVGLLEAVHLSFANPLEFPSRALPSSSSTLDAAHACVLLLNPMSEALQGLRQTLLSGLWEAALRAQRHQVASLRLFEVGRVFWPASMRPRCAGQEAREEAGDVRDAQDALLPWQPRRLGVLYGGTSRPWVGVDEDADFYKLKGMLQDALEPLLQRRIDTVPCWEDLNNAEVPLSFGAGGNGAAVTHELPFGTDSEGHGSEDASLPSSVVKEAALQGPDAEVWTFLHPRQRGVVRVGSKVVGVVGVLHPRLLHEAGWTGPACYAELSVHALMASAKQGGRSSGPLLAHPPPRFPSTERDIAMVVDEQLPLEWMLETLREGAGPLAEDIVVFDVYRGAQIPAGKKSWALRFCFRATGRTLGDAEVDAALERATDLASARFDVILRAP